MIWVDVDRLDLSPGAKSMVLQLGVPGDVGGDVSSKFEPAEPFKFLAP
ncbi:hypothetical protein [Methanosarcina acetivorans]|nr:hypothetical protein [Methanosarcina acetivorans]